MPRPAKDLRAGRRTRRGAAHADLAPLRRGPVAFRTGPDAHPARRRSRRAPGRAACRPLVTCTRGLLLRGDAAVERSASPGLIQQIHRKAASQEQGAESFPAVGAVSAVIGGPCSRRVVRGHRPTDAGPAAPTRLAAVTNRAETASSGGFHDAGEQNRCPLAVQAQRMAAASRSSSVTAFGSVIIALWAVCRTR